MTISMCGDGADKKESQVQKITEGGETGGQCAGGRTHAVEFYVEFKPIEHPLQPDDDDRPVKCPVPDSSLLNKDGGIWKEQFAESLRKRSEVSVANEESIVVIPHPPPPPAQAVRKRHHTLTRDHTIILAPFRPPQSNNFQMFQGCNEFKS